jgi:hypothetical protein
MNLLVRAFLIFNSITPPQADLRLFNGLPPVAMPSCLSKLFELKLVDYNKKAHPDLSHQRQLKVQE